MDLGTAALSTEQQRLAALASYDILDTPREREFDDIAQMAAQACGTPIAYINFIDDHRQWYKAEVGLGVCELPRQPSICVRALQEGDILLLPDLTRDPEFAESIFVTGPLQARFYAGVPLRTPDGLAIGTLCVIDHVARDLTDQQLFILRALARTVMAQLEMRRAIAGRECAEAELRAVNQGLETSIAEALATRDGIEAALRQSQKLEAVGQLTGGVAHDFNNLLTVIRSSVDLLARPNLAEERRQRYLAAITDTVARAAKLTNQLLAFARRQTLKPEVFDAGQSAAGIADMVGTLTGARIHVSLEVAATDCLIKADPSQFGTALVNLALNARDAIEGEGQLTMAVAPAVGVPADAEHPAVAGAFIAVSVSDTGSGVAPAHLAQIFEPFFTTKGIGHGTGLGLSQVFGFTKQSGGEVRVRSIVGQGSTFTLYLPEATGAVTVPASPESVSAGLVEGRGTRVLVVEDNTDIAGFVTQALADLGYAPTLALNADEALATLSDAPPFDVVFSDVMMPGMSGIDLAHEIRTRDAGLPVLLTSGYSQELAQQGTQGFILLHKPYSIEELTQLLKRHVRERPAGETVLTGA